MTKQLEYGVFEAESLIKLQQQVQRLLGTSRTWDGFGSWSLPSRWICLGGIQVSGIFRKQYYQAMVLLSEDK